MQDGATIPEEKGEELQQQEQEQEYSSIRGCDFGSFFYLKGCSFIS